MLNHEYFKLLYPDSVDFKISDDIVISVVYSDFDEYFNGEREYHEVSIFRNGEELIDTGLDLQSRLVGKLPSVGLYMLLTSSESDEFMHFIVKNDGTLLHDEIGLSDVLAVGSSGNIWYIMLSDGNEALYDMDKLKFISDAHKSVSTLKSIRQDDKLYVAIYYATEAGYNDSICGSICTFNIRKVCDKLGINTTGYINDETVNEVVTYEEVYELVSTVDINKTGEIGDFLNLQGTYYESDGIGKCTSSLQTEDEYRRCRICRRENGKVIEILDNANDCKNSNTIVIPTNDRVIVKDRGTCETSINSTHGDKLYSIPPKVLKIKEIDTLDGRYTLIDFINFDTINNAFNAECNGKYLNKIDLLNQSMNDRKRTVEEYLRHLKKDKPDIRIESAASTALYKGSFRDIVDELNKKWEGSRFNFEDSLIPVDNKHVSVEMDRQGLIYITVYKESRLTIYEAPSFGKEFDMYKISDTGVEFMGHYDSMQKFRLLNNLDLLWRDRKSVKMYTAYSSMVFDWGDIESAHNITVVGKDSLIYTDTVAAYEEYLIKLISLEGNGG